MVCGQSICDSYYFYFLWWVIDLLCMNINTFKNRYCYKGYINSINLCPQWKRCIKKKRREKEEEGEEEEKGELTLLRFCRAPGATIRLQHTPTHSSGTIVFLLPHKLESHYPVSHKTSWILAALQGSWFFPTLSRKPGQKLTHVAQAHRDILMHLGSHPRSICS